VSLRGVSAVLSRDGSPTIRLVKTTSEGQRELESLLIVPATDAHRSFIIGTWVKSYQAQARAQSIEAFYSKNEPAIAESRWDDAWVLTDEDGFTVHAWVCGNDGRLYHCYVVPQLRKLRIATRLIEFACGADGVKEYARPWPYGAHARVNPYLLRAK
jgi:GNAT superfamily N-acetyltransferase